MVDFRLSNEDERGASVGGAHPMQSGDLSNIYGESAASCTVITHHEKTACVQAANVLWVARVGFEPTTDGL